MFYLASLDVSTSSSYKPLQTKPQTRVFQSIHTHLEHFKEIAEWVAIINLEKAHSNHNNTQVSSLVCKKEKPNVMVFIFCCTNMTYMHTKQDCWNGAI